MSEHAPFRATGPYGPAKEIIPKSQHLLAFPAQTNLLEALERLLDENYSQAPVVTNGEITGMLSLKQVVRGLLEDDAVRVRLAGMLVGAHIESAKFVPRDQWVDTQVDWLDDATALVGEPASVEGIITHADLLRRVHDFTRAFLEIAEIEAAYRHILESLCPLASWRAEYDRVFEALRREGKDLYLPKDYKDFDHKHYEHVLRDVKFAELIQPHAHVHMSRLAEMAQSARFIRNDVMHFKRPVNPDMVEKLEQLREQLQLILKRIKQKQETKK